MMAAVDVERIPVAEGVSLHTVVWPEGSAPPFLLVHGLSSNCRTWEAVARLLHAGGHPVATVDLRGHGQSDKADEGYDFATLTSDLVAVIRALGFERPIVAGQSTGGNLAVELGYRHPDLAAGLVGVDGGVLELSEQWPRWEDCEAALAPPRFAGTPAAEFERRIRRSHPGWSDEGVAATLANCEVLPDGTVRPWLTFDRHMRILRALWEQKPSALIPRLAVPLLLLLAGSGNEGSSSKSRAVERAVGSGAAVRVEWFPGGDHDLHVQQPAVVADLLHAAVEEGFFPP
jgi:pimeloyl-ACP methyl ester carboxylesterase